MTNVYLHPFFELLFFSALSADVDSISKWSESKARGEIGVREEFPDAVRIFRANVYLTAIFREISLARSLFISQSNSLPSSLSGFFSPSSAFMFLPFSGNVSFSLQIIVRPATVFGAEDRFLNWIAEGSCRMPFFPLINDGNALVQPIYSGDVGKALMSITYVSTLQYSSVHYLHCIPKVHYRTVQY